MKIYHEKADGPDEIVTKLTEMIEKEVGAKIFTIRVFDSEKDSEINALVVFEDKRILEAVITIQVINGEMACRIRGNFIEQAAAK